MIKKHNFSGLVWLIITFTLLIISILYLNSYANKYAKPLGETPKLAKVHISHRIILQSFD